MKKKLTVVVLLFVCCVIGRPVIAAKAAPVVKPGDALPRLVSRHELSSQERSYLGLPSGRLPFMRQKEFLIGDIQADIIVIEFFNRYCSSCQALAPVLNRVHEQVQDLTEPGQKIRFIGIGAGNNAREIAAFKQEKSVSFPLIPDPDFEMYNAVGDPGGTPFTIIVKKRDGKAAIAAVSKGLIHEPGHFIDLIREAAGLAPAAASAAAETDTAPPDERMLALDLSEEKVRELIRGAMRRASPDGTKIRKLTARENSSGGQVYRGALVSADGTRTVLYAQLISRKPVCDVCHGIHFIVAFDPQGTVRGFSPVHVTKYGNVLWNDRESGFMRQRLVGRSIRTHHKFDPQVDAVSTATMSSALIVNSVNNLKDVLQEIEQQQE